MLESLLHIDRSLAAAVAQYGTWTYPLLFAIVFAETGLVVTPFLPGDSLLFAAGALAAAGGLNPFGLFALLFAAATLGDAVNYAIGRKVGRAAVAKGRLWRFPIRREYVERTREYFARYGARTIVIARFIPIVRTFAPFVAGVGEMRYRTFAAYNVAGAALWTGSFVSAGFFFGNIPAVKERFTLVVLGIVAVSCLPVAYELYRARRTR